MKQFRFQRSLRWDKHGLHFRIIGIDDVWYKIKLSKVWSWNKNKWLSNGNLKFSTAMFGVWSFPPYDIQATTPNGILSNLHHIRTAVYGF